MSYVSVELVYQVVAMTDCGSTFFTVSANDSAAELLADPMGWVAAKVFDLTREEYIDWVDNEGRVQCSGTTSRGERCKFMTARGLSMEEWKRLRASEWACVFHE